MGKVVPLSAARKRGVFRASAPANQDDGATPRARASWLRTIGRGARHVGVAVLRALAVGIVEVLLSTLLFLSRPARLLLRIGFIGLFLVVVVEGMNHWRDKHLLVLIGLIALASILGIGFYDTLISCLYRVRSIVKKG